MSDSDNLLTPILIDYTAGTYFKALLFKPYVRLYEFNIAKLLYNSPVFKDSIINIYPAMEGDSNNINNGYCFIAFDRFKLANCVEEYKTFVTNPSVKGMVNHPSKDIAVIILKLKDENQPIFDNYMQGKFTEMFSLRDLKSIKQIFKRPKESGLPIREFNFRDSYDLSLHILLYTEEYEKLRAEDLNIPYLKFKGTTTQAIAPIELEEETLNIDILCKQYKKYNV